MNINQLRILFSDYFLGHVLHVHGLFILPKMDR